MRRSVYFLTPLIPLALVACEDGPNQTFQPATGTLFNNGDTPAAVTDAGDPLNQTFGASTATQICSGQELQQQWGAMIAQPLAPVRFMAGLDLDNGPNFPLLTIEQAELGPTFPVETACVSQPAARNATDGEYGATPGQALNPNDPCYFAGTSTVPNTQEQCAALAQAGLASKTAPQCGWNVIPASAAFLQSQPAPNRLCQPTVIGPGGNGSDVGGSLLVQWGNNGEFQMEWAVPTHKAYVMFLNPGYNGQMQWNYVTPSDGKVHTYVYQISKVITKDGDPKGYPIDWEIGSKYPGEVDELYRGIASTYAPDIYDDAPAAVTCNQTGTCLAYANAQDGTGRALFGMRPVSFYMFFDPPTLPAPSGFTVQSAYLFNIKYAPYSGISSYFKMYDGPLDGGGLAGGGDAAAAQPYADGLLGNQSPKKHCHFGMGDTFENLLTNCIDVFLPPSGCSTVGSACDTINQTAQNKVLGDLAHDDQNFSFAVVGINQNFRPVKLDICTPALCGGAQPTAAGTCPAGTAGATNCGTDTEDVIHDTDNPLQDPTNSYANNFQSDVRSFGPIQNDFSPPGSALVSLQTGAAVPCTTDADCSAAGVVPLANTSTYYPVPGVCDTTPTDPNTGLCVGGAFSKEYHGSGAVYREYGRLVQADMNAQYVAAHGGGGTANPAYRHWHDSACYFPEACFKGATPVPTGTTPTTCGAAGGHWVVGPTMNATPLTQCAADADCAAIVPTSTCNLVAGGGLLAKTCVVPFDVNTWRAAPGCTGFEGWFSAVEPAGDPDLADNAPTPGDDIWDGQFYAPYGLGGGFKPGTPQGMFCNDPGTYNFCGLSGDIQGLEGDLLGSSTTRLLEYLGVGDVLNLPLEGRDRRYFFKQWLTAYAKYMTSATVLDTGLGSAGVPGYNGLQVDIDANGFPSQIHNQYIDSDDFIFDSFGGGASRSEFIDFAAADVNNDPVDIEQKVLILSTNLQATNFYRKLDREERALFNSLATDRTQASWGYIKDATGNFVQDMWPADVQPTTACATNADCTTPTATYTPQALTGAPTLACDLVTGDPYKGQCVYAYPRHNANPFITNLAGSAVLITGVTGIPATWKTPVAICTPGTAGCTQQYTYTPAPAGWVDPCNPVTTPPATCTIDADCPGVMSCQAGACVAAVTAYYCATHSPNDPVAAPLCAIPGVDNWMAPLNPDGTLVRRANGKPLIEGYCGVWQPSPYALTTNAVTPSPLFPTAKGVNATGVAPGIEIVKTFPDTAEALVSLPTFPNPYNADPATNKKPVLVMVPWLPQQEGVGYPVAANGSEDVFVETAQLDFTGQVITPTLDYYATGTTAPYGVQVLAWETPDFLGEVFLCVDGVTAANRYPAAVPGDMLTAHMYSSALTIVDWLATHPGAQNACQIVVRYSQYDNYPDFITSLVGGVRLDIEQGAGYGRVVDATLFAPGTGSVATP